MDMDGEFLKKLASEEPAPGGGTASAMAGSMGAALLSMVAKLSRKENPGAEPVSQKGEALLEACLNLSHEDEEAFARVVAAFRLPRKTDDEKTARGKAVEDALKEATRVPLQTAQTALELLRSAEAFLPSANKNAISDIGVSALLAHAAVEGAILNVFINLGSLKDKNFVEDHRLKAEAIRADAKSRAENILRNVNRALSPSPVPPTSP